MDNNKPKDPTAATAAPVEPIPTDPLTQAIASQPVPSSPVVPPVSGTNPTVPGGKSNMMIYFAIGGAVLVIILGIVVYMLMQGNGKKPVTESAGVNVADLQTEADQIEDEDLDKDFEEVDKDLQEL